MQFVKIRFGGKQTLFTATSAVCVTGLVVQDTGSYWSTFGQAVILALIQIGGLGVVTVAASFALLSGRRISLMQRSTMQDAISAPKVGGIVRLTRFILRGTFLIELLGALAMLPVFCRDYGWRGIWMAVFHSISAFCNAGFDILGTESNLYPSLTGYAGSPVINVTIMLLIVVGGIGFLTWDDICENKWQLHRYRMQSKVILVTTGLLIFLPAVFFFFSDFSALSAGNRLLASFFQSVTPRTAGFNTVNLSAMSGASQGVMILLMLIGGSPGSTAGGMKTTTLPYVTNAQIGDSTNAEFLRSLGIGNFDVCIVTISGNFQNSLETTSLLKELGAKCVVSRAERDVQAKFLLRNGADHVVYPEKQVAKWAAIRYTADHIFDYIEIDEQHAIFEVEVPEGWVGKSIGELNIRRKFGINILGIKHSGKTDVSITPDTVLSGEITILALGEYKALQKCFRI